LQFIKLCSWNIDSFVSFHIYFSNIFLQRISLKKIKTLALQRFEHPFDQKTASEQNILATIFKIVKGIVQPQKGGGGKRGTNRHTLALQLDGLERYK
jgi:hypothetical protein